MEIKTTKSKDGRPSLTDLYEIWTKAIPSGWTTKCVTTQSLLLDNGSRVDLPIYAYYNSKSVDLIFLGGIHGREPAGAIALAKEANYLIEQGTKKGILIMPLLNPWGYYQHNRYGPFGRSVTDCEHLLGKLAKAACPEAEIVGQFLMKEINVNPGALVLDLHEDPGYEEGGTPYKTTGTYMYIIGKDARLSPVSERVKETLKTCALPLIQEGKTRFGEEIANGIVENSSDGSVDELLSVLGASPVITLETLLLAECDPELNVRVGIYQQIIQAFISPF